MDVWPKLDDTVAMDTTFETNTTNNPFHTNNAEPPHTNGGAEDSSYQKANMLLDLSGGESYKLNASVPSETDLFFLNRPANGKGDGAYDEDDFGPETDVDAVDDVLLSPAIAAAKVAAETARADLEVQKQQLDAFDPCSREPREETPTPPADDVSSGPALLPESENVAESGEESEDEWNYYRVEPAEKSEQQPPARTAAETEEEDDDDNMESRLNPNAAEFVPSPTSVKPSMEELISASPRKGGIAMDDVPIPSPVQFQEEVCLRPSELDHNPFTENEISENLLPDLLNGKTELNSNEKNPYQILENVSDIGESEPVNPFKSSDLLFDKSEVSSTKAEFGDETAASFLADITGGDDLLHSANANNSGCINLDASMAEADFFAANIPEEVIDEELSKPQDTFASVMETCEQNICFELEKEFVPSVEPEAYQVPVFTDNENVCMEVNSTPLNQELGQMEFIPPVNVDFLPEVTNQLRESVEDFMSEPLPNASLSNCAFSFNKDISGLVADFTEELVQPILSPVPLSPDIEVSKISSGIETIDLDTNASNLVQLETELISPVEVEPIVSAAPEVIEFDTKMEVCNQFTESRIVEEDFSSKLLSQGHDHDVHIESVKEVVNEFQLEEPMIITSEDNKPHEESPKADDISLLSGIAGQLAAASVVTAAVVGTALSGSESPETKELQKKPVADKAKPSTKTTLGAKSGTLPLKSQSKLTPTSPTKPLAPTSRSAPIPKKPTTTTTTSRATSKTATTTTATKVTAPSKPAPSSTITSKVTASSTSQVRVKVGSSPTKPSAPVKLAPAKTAAPAKPRSSPLAAAKAPLTEKKTGVTNGDVRPPIKRPETLATKKMIPSTATKPLSRPATAPVASKSTTKSVPSSRTTPVSTAAPKPITRPAVNGVAKPKTTTTTTTSVRARPLSATSKVGTIDKQVKDTANKQISSVGAKSSTLSRTATSTTTRKAVGGVTKTTTTTTVTKSSSILGKKPIGSTVTKTSEIITVTPSEVVVVEGFTTTVTKDDSPIIDNAQIEVISSTD